MWVRLVKKFINYAAGCAYTAYCLFNINGWVKSHSDIGIYVLIPWITAVIAAVLFLILKLFAKRKYNFAMPLFFLCIGIVISAVGLNIPCCTGG